MIGGMGCWAGRWAGPGLGLAGLRGVRPGRAKGQGWVGPGRPGPRCLCSDIVFVLSPSPGSGGTHSQSCQSSTASDDDNDTGDGSRPGPTPELRRLRRLQLRAAAARAWELQGESESEVDAGAGGPGPGCPGSPPSVGGCVGEGPEPLAEPAPLGPVPAEGDGHPHLELGMHVALGPEEGPEALAVPRVPPPVLPPMPLEPPPVPAAGPMVGPTGRGRGQGRGRGGGAGHARDRVAPGDREEPWGPWSLSKVMGPEGQIGWGGNCRCHSNDHDEPGTYCKKQLTYGKRDTLPDAMAKLKVKRWLLAGAEIPDEGNALARRTQVCVNARALEWPVTEEDCDTRLVELGWSP